MRRGFGMSFDRECGKCGRLLHPELKICVYNLLGVVVRLVGGGLEGRTNFDWAL